MNLDFVKCSRLGLWVEACRVERKGEEEEGKRRKTKRKEKQRRRTGKRTGTVSQANDHAPPWSCKKKGIDFSDALAIPKRYLDSPKRIGSPTACTSAAASSRSASPSASNY